MALAPRPKPLASWFGGKARMAPIIAGKVNTIQHRNWVEPYCGMSGVTMAKKPSKVEVLNDLHDGLITLYQVVRDPNLCMELLRLLELTPYARAEWRHCNTSWANEINPVEKARMVYVTLSQNFVGVTKNGSWSFGGPKYDSNVVRNFYSSLENIQAVSQRLKNVMIENAPAMTIINQWAAGCEDTLFYLDPPYLPETRKRNPAEYLHEMTKQHHEELLDWCIKANNKIILSGYYSSLYADALETKGWVREDYRAYAASAMQSARNGLKGKPGDLAVRTECLWFSPNIAPKTLWDFEREVI